MITVKRLSIDDARVLIEGAEEKSREIGVPMCSAVTDEAGNLIAFTRMDGAKISSISIAMDKAFTAAAAKKGTHEYNQLAVPGKPTFGIHVTNQGRFSIIGGGLPIIINDEVVGGIGISGGTAEEDQIVAQGAIDYSLSKIEAAK
ncbi:MAG: heme-binding protein [Acidobacteria bacterium]|nr:heme-binding protein [Acidobacteriota bacterium]